MSDYRAAPALRFYVHPNNIGLVDLADIVEMWHRTDETWGIRYKSHPEPSVFHEKSGRAIFTALCAYRREVYS